MPDVTLDLSAIANGLANDANAIRAQFLALQTTVNDLDDANLAAAANIAGSKLANLAVSTAKIADLAVTAAKIEAQQAWQSVALGGAFTAAQTLFYYKDSLGIVHFRGDVQTVGGLDGVAPVATVPAGYRPVTTVYMPLTRINANSHSSVSISAAGVVTPTGGLLANGTYSFGAVSYRAEN